MIPGAKETLDALDGTILTGIVTNKRGIYARQLAEHLGFARGMFRIIGAQDGFKAKPAADMFEEFILSAGVDKERTIYVGDSPVDVESAVNAGIDAFVVAGPIFSAEELARCGFLCCVTSPNCPLPFSPWLDPEIRFLRLPCPRSLLAFLGNLPDISGV